MRSGPRYLLVVALLAGGGCGRVGFEAVTDAGADSESDADPNITASIDASVGAIVDASSVDGRRFDGAVCGTAQGNQCSGTTVVLSPTGSTELGGNFVVFPQPLEPVCAAGVIAERRLRIVAPDTPIRAIFEVSSNEDVILSIYRETCQGEVLSCTSIPASGGSAVAIEMGADEGVIVSAASVSGCGEVTIHAAAEPPGGA